MYQRRALVVVNIAVPTLVTKLGILCCHNFRTSCKHKRRSSYDYDANLRKVKVLLSESVQIRSHNNVASRMHIVSRSVTLKQFALSNTIQNQIRNTPLLKYVYQRDRERDH